jgi:tetratricopeptide (TPR) repeat protein
MNTGCLDEDRIVAFLDGTLSDDSRSEFEAHIATCGVCADLATWAAADHAHRSRVPGEEGRPFVGALAPGARVDRYQVLGAVGRGGMGEVYAAYHPDLDRRIALKVVGGAGADSAERRARLLREARAIARLSHPNVVAVHDAGAVDDRVYIAMEFVEGETVDAWLRAQPRSWQTIADVFISAARGLAAAHAAGVVHRDFKPQNVMIGRDGSVRVMDFGLARLAGEPADAMETGDLVDRRPAPATVTKTGALVGTLAYMSPEQFRGDQLDARTDQFSFCVAFHEALYANRPALAHVPGAPSVPGAPGLRGAGVPAWLRAIVTRGLAADRRQRFPSMEQMIRALERGRTRPRRRALTAGVALAVALVAFGGWRVARGSRIRCEVPADRLAAAWSGHEDARRQAVHRSFVASGRPSAETSWQRVSRALDDYIARWSAMYVETCEATHVRGEQSSEVLDLRMTCLNDNLDRVRALTSVFDGGDNAIIGRAVAATHDLTPISRCADLALLRTAVPLPRDQRTLETVLALRASLREAQALRDVGNFREALGRAKALQAPAAATGYGPLLAELLELMGCAAAVGEDPVGTEKTLHQALFTAEAARDDETAARVAADLVYVTGVYLNRSNEAEMWMHLSEAILDRIGPGHERIRSWVLNNFGAVLLMHGDLERAERLARESVALKEKVLGNDHPDVALSVGTLSSILEEMGRAAEALVAADRALAILAKNGDPDSDSFARAQTTRGEALVALHRGAEAEAAFSIALRIYREHREDSAPLSSFPLHGLGAARLAQGAPDKAIPVLEEALRIREAHWPNEVIVGEAQFSLARALWEGDRDRKRSLDLAQQARKAFGSHRFPRREKAVIHWLAEHKPDVL